MFPLEQTRDYSTKRRKEFGSIGTGADAQRERTAKDSLHVATSKIGPRFIANKHIGNSWEAYAKAMGATRDDAFFV